jgi:hypothetical protein
MALSYSGYTTYLNCPSAFQRKYITKEEGGGKPTRETAPAMFRGTDMHNAIEDLILGKREVLPKELSNYQGFVCGLRDMGAQPELAFAFNAKWEMVDFEAEEAEIRGFLDVYLAAEQLIVYEWKTGKEYDDHVTQRNLYGLAALLMNTDYETVRVITTYLDQGYNRETTYHRPMLTTYKWVWGKNINKVKPPQPYPMRPSWKCRNCQFSKNKGGKCPN